MPQNNRHPALDKLLLDKYKDHKDADTTTTLEASQVPLKASSTEETTTLTETTTPTDET